METRAHTVRTAPQVPGLHRARAGEMLFSHSIQLSYSGSKTSINVICLIAFYNRQRRGTHWYLIGNGKLQIHTNECPVAGGFQGRKCYLTDFMSQRTIRMVSGVEGGCPPPQIPGPCFMPSRATCYLWQRRTERTCPAQMSSQEAMRTRTLAIEVRA